MPFPGMPSVFRFQKVNKYKLLNKRKFLNINAKHKVQSIKQQLIIVNNHGRIHKAQEQSEGRKVSRTEAERKYLRYFLLMHANTDINKYTYICIMHIQSYTPYMISHLRLADMINVDC